MGMLVDGKWVDRWYDTGKTGGRFMREPSVFRHKVTADGSSGYLAQSGRYHLYVSLACPWAHRALIFRNLKGLQDVISVSVVDPRMGEFGWVFGDYPGATSDEVNHAERLYEVYLRADSSYTGRVTTPILWDKETHSIVSNESGEIIRMLNSEFNAWGDASRDYYPTLLRSEIDRLNAIIYDNVNNGVYKAGFATTQVAYDAALSDLFTTLNMLEEHLGKQRYLVGPTMTEADWRLFVTLARFDIVYFGHFKCNLKQIREYPNLSDYTRELYQIPGVAETVSVDHIKTHYYWSHPNINPSRIIPRGPVFDLAMANQRGETPP